MNKKLSKYFDPLSTAIVLGIVGIVFLTVVYFAVSWYLNRVFDHITDVVVRKGTFWETEDGTLSFENGVEDRIRKHELYNGRIVDVNIGHGRTGVIVSGNDEIPINVDLSEEGSYLSVLCVYLDDGHLDAEVITGNEESIILEKWALFGAKETDSQIVLTYKVIETTYFEVGQKIKLIHNKS